MHLLIFITANSVFVQNNLSSFWNEVAYKQTNKFSPSLFPLAVPPYMHSETQARKIAIIRLSLSSLPSHLPILLSSCLDIFQTHPSSPCLLLLHGKAFEWFSFFLYSFNLSSTSLLLPGSTHNSDSPHSPLLSSLPDHPQPCFPTPLISCG